MKIRVATYYAGTKKQILERIIQGSLLHIDETRANIKGQSAFVWVLTSHKEVAYILSESREGEIAHKLLADFKGVLVSDFYTAVKCKERFEKNRDKLFTFLKYDGVPWNNNNAEHAIKAFARLRDVIAGSSTEKGIDEYLTLLSICQTCKYSGIDFLDFLRSGETSL